MRLPPAGELPELTAVIASEAKQSIVRQKRMDCFASLAMTR
jgi:hypothetical protein